MRLPPARARRREASAGRLALLLDDLLEDQCPLSVEPPATAVADLMRAGQGHLHGPGALGPADEKCSEAVRAGMQRGGRAARTG